MGREVFYNIITVLMLMFTVAAVIILGGLAVLLPEQTPVAVQPTVFELPSATPTIRGPTQEPTPQDTPTLPLAPSLTVTPSPTATTTLTPTPDATQLRETAIVRETEDFDPTNTPIPPAYVVEDEAVDYEPNPAGDGGCDVSVVAGNVLDADDEGVEGLTITLTGDDLDRTELTGNEPQYGDGGWEFVLGDGPRGEVVFIQLFDADGDPLSASIAVELIDECDVNRAILTFVAAEG
jgi:hypothetical protein